MTPQEELFAQLFNHEKLLVKDMDTLTLRAHREELAKIAFEARARLTAVDDEDNNRKKIAKGDKGQGFSRSVNVDETTTEAINVVKERQARMSKKDKMLNNLISMYEMSGMSHDEAVKTATSAMGAGKILEQIKSKEQSSPEAPKDRSEQIIKGETIHSPLGQENGFVIMKKDDAAKPSEAEPQASKPLFNPFAK